MALQDVQAVRQDETVQIAEDHPARKFRIPVRQVGDVMRITPTEFDALPAELKILLRQARLDRYRYD